MNKRIALLLVAVMCAPFAGVAARADGTWLAGAAKVDISPPSTGHRVGTGTCPSTFDAPSLWDFDEPYVDVNGNGDYDLGEPYCDANANGRYDGIWVVGQANHHAHVVNDPIWARAFAVSDGTNTDVIVSVDSLGLFNSDIDRAKTLVAAALGPNVHVIVSANHDESTPDSIGLWGPGQPDATDALGVGQSSGVNDYYMNFLEQRIALAAIEAAAPSSLHPAMLRVFEGRDDNVLPSLNGGGFPTTNKRESAAQTVGRIDAWNPKVKILEADYAGTDHAIFRTLNYDAHMQNLGHSDDPYWSHAITGDWNGFYNDDVERDCRCVSIYVAGTVGSIETASVAGNDAPEGTLERSSSVGHELARFVDANAEDATVLPFGDVKYAHDRFEIPLENQLFIAAFGLGLFPHKSLSPPPADANAIATGRPWLQTDVSVARIGALEFNANPGESFPALMKGSHWGIDEVCSTRANPPVPTQYEDATYRWDAGLADDMIGYELPAWGWDSDNTTFVDPRDPCSTDGGDAQGHRHGLEDESTGPSGGNMVAEHLAALVQDVDGAASPVQIVPGRYIVDGAMSRRPYIAEYQASDEDAGHMPVETARASGIVYGSGHTTALAGRDGTFVDFDGQPQSEADFTTRGFLLNDGETIYLDVFPAYS